MDLNLQKSNLHKSGSFTNTFRLIDGLCHINDNGLFGKQFKEIYPEGLELKRENLSSTKDSFLDIDLEIKKIKFQSNFLISGGLFPNLKCLNVLFFQWF